MKRVSLHALGCRLNQAEGLLLRDLCVKAGYVEVEWGAPADLVILNTCTVTREAEYKCRKAVRQVIGKSPEAFVAVIGCYSQTGAAALAKIPGVDVILGTQHKLEVLNYVGLGKQAVPLVVRERISPEAFEIPFAGEVPFNQRANLKVQDGCDFVCSFCIIPRARGPARSRRWENTLEEGRAAAARGIRELVLTGVNIGTYGEGGHDLVDLVDALHAIPGLRRLRISSIEPTTVPEGLLERMADPGHKLQPYLHLPIQSGSDPILEVMRRRYRRGEVAAFVRAAAARVPDLCLGTDILVGHPGETEADFEATRELFAELPFAYTHVFPFSERPGTRTALMLGRAELPRVSEAEIGRRGAVLRQLSQAKMRAFAQRHVGQEVEVLLENAKEGGWPGYTPNYIRVFVPGPYPEDLANRLVRVRLETAEADFAQGRLVRLVA